MYKSWPDLVFITLLFLGGRIVSEVQNPADSP